MRRSTHDAPAGAGPQVRPAGPERGATVEITGLDEGSARRHSTLTGEPAGKG
ncbi:hypothetical protein [Streptomyces bauhiniae]|uniref:hypothetical protein n=1 Tax=Streptomyces bauhiniae TaxID=2340725 RepID=UPI003655E6FF